MSIATASRLARIRPYVRERGAQITLQTTTLRMLTPSAIGSASNKGQGAMYVDPAWFALTGKTAKLLLSVELLSNDTAPAITFTFGLYPVTLPTGATGALTYTSGALIAASAVPLAPTANDASKYGDATFDVPAAGHYAVGLVGSGTQATGSDVDARCVVSQVWA